MGEEYQQAIDSLTKTVRFGTVVVELTNYEGKVANMKAMPPEHSYKFTDTAEALSWIIQSMKDLKGQEFSGSVNLNLTMHQGKLKLIRRQDVKHEHFTNKH